LAAPLILKLSEEFDYFRPSKFVALRSKEHQDAVNLCFRLVTLTPSGVVEKSFGDWTLSVELPKGVNIRRFRIHSRLSRQASAQARVDNLHVDRRPPAARLPAPISIAIE